MFYLTYFLNIKYYNLKRLQLNNKMYTEDYVTNYHVSNDNLKAFYNKKMENLLKKDSSKEESKEEYNLKPPYTINEIKKYYVACQITFPKDLHDYLLNISREIIVGDVPFLFDLADTSNIGKCEIKMDSKIYSEGDCPTHGHKRCTGLSKDSTKQCPNFGTDVLCNFVHRRKKIYLCHCPDINMYGGMVQIGEHKDNVNGDKYDFIVLNGNNIGSVWTDNDNGKIYKKSSSFSHYVKSAFLG